MSSYLREDVNYLKNFTNDYSFKEAKKNSGIWNFKWRFAITHV